MNRGERLLSISFFVIIASFSFVSAKSELIEPVNFIYAASFWTTLMTIFLLSLKEHIDKKYYKLLFWLIAAPILISTFYLAGHTVYENIVSETKGPVHWHADYQVLVCGERLDLIDPRFPSNKIGSPLFHEHNDDRIHIEGTVMYIKDINFGSYFRVIGGDLKEGYMKYPTNDGVVEVKDGDTCPSGSVGTLKVYVNGKRIENYDTYEIYPNANVPPGDCIIVKFDSANDDTTDVICTSWDVRGWSYDNYEREVVSVGDRTWQ